MIIADNRFLITPFKMYLLSGLTKEIAEAIERALHPLGVGVVIEATHMVRKF